MLVVHLLVHFWNTFVYAFDTLSITLLLDLYDICGILLYTFDHSCGTLFDILCTTLVLHIWKLHYGCGSSTITVWDSHKGCLGIP
jgi:hypothetical protein